MAGYPEKVDVNAEDVAEHPEKGDVNAGDVASDEASDEEQAPTLAELPLDDLLEMLKKEEKELEQKSAYVATLRDIVTEKSVAMTTGVTLNIVYAKEWKMENATMTFSASETLAGLRGAIGKSIMTIKKSSWKSLVLTLGDGKVVTNESGRKGFSKIGIKDNDTIYVTFSDEKEADRIAKAKSQIAKAKAKSQIAKAKSKAMVGTATGSSK